MSTIKSLLLHSRPPAWHFRSACPPLALLGFLLLLTGCGPQTGSQTPTSTIPGAFASVQMIDARTGWAVSWDIAGTGAYSILKTGDGGRHWKTMLRCLSAEDQGRGFFKPCSTDFHSASVAAVVQPEYDSQTQTYRRRIFHTSDGGATWQSSEIAARDLETPPVFIDGLHGWVFATDHFPGPDPSSAYIGGQIALYRTTDGGNTWQRVASGPSTPQIPTTTDDGYGIPPLAASAQMQFITPQTGWLIGSSLHPDDSSYSWLYVTHDGGSSWQPVNLSFPAQATAPWRPTFFNDQDGLFPVSISGPAPQNTPATLLYSTRDGGQTWASTAVPFDVTSAVFLDLQHAIAPPTDTTGKALSTTSDGGKHWTTVPIQTTFTRLYAFNFVSPALGWALADNRTHFFPEPGGGLQKGDVITLLHTTDGGRTWQEIARSIV
jgi:photosystem II stability/assembly factor-like uncharacterized protein